MMKRFVIGLLIAGSLALPGTTVLADASIGASCIGIGSSGAGPHVRDDIALLIKEIYAEEGYTTIGGAYATFAKEHNGNFFDCFGPEPPPPPHP